MDKLTREDMDTLIFLCNFRITNREHEIRTQAADGASIVILKGILTDIESIESLKRKLIDIKKGR